MPRSTSIALVLMASACFSTHDTSQSSDASERVVAKGVFLITRPDTRRCTYPVCGGVYVALANKPTTACADGAPAADCYVGKIDSSALRLDDEVRRELDQLARERRLLVRGTLVSGPVPVLRAEEVHRSTGEAPPTAPIYRISVNTAPCSETACASYDTVRVNSSEPALSVFKLSLMQELNESEVEAAEHALYAGGILASGGVVIESQDPAFLAETIFLPFVAQPDPCADVVLPACPAECPDSPSEMAGTACSADGDRCGNEIGDGCSCQSGSWICAPHAPLGPGDCNLVCTREAAP